MNPNQLRSWWLRKRILFPLTLLIGVAATSLIAFVNSDSSTIVIYNETDSPLPPLLVRACGQTRTFSMLEDQESGRFALKPEGAESAIHLELATDPPLPYTRPDPPRVQGSRRGLHPRPSIPLGLSF